ncbi:MAG: BON domain-containing protein [Planctomycetota bacterium]
MVASAGLQQTQRHIHLGQRVAQELRAASFQRFQRITVRGLLCGFVELDGVVSSYFAKSLALQIARQVSGVTDVIDRIRVGPVSAGSPTRILYRIELKEPN